MPKRRTYQINDIIVKQFAEPKDIQDVAQRSLMMVLIEKRNQYNSKCQNVVQIK